MKNLLSLLFLASALMVFSCGKDEEPTDDDGGGSTCDTMNLTYVDDIKSILDQSCANAPSCHAVEAVTNGLGSMHDYENTKMFIDNNEVVKAINHEEGVEAMPRPVGSDKLPQCTIDKITDWIADGAPEE